MISKTPLNIAEFQKNDDVALFLRQNGGRMESP